MITFETPPEIKALLEIPHQLPEIIVRPDIRIQIQPKGSVLDKLSIEYWGFPLWAWALVAIVLLRR